MLPRSWVGRRFLAVLSGQAFFGWLIYLVLRYADFSSPTAYVLLAGDAIFLLMGFHLLVLVGRELMSRFARRRI